MSLVPLVFAACIGATVSGCGDDGGGLTVGPGGILGYEAANLNDDTIDKVAVTFIEPSGTCPFDLPPFANVRGPLDSPHFIGYADGNAVWYDSDGTVLDCVELELDLSGASYQPRVSLADGSFILTRRTQGVGSSSGFDVFLATRTGDVTQIDTAPRTPGMIDEGAFLGSERAFVRERGEFEREEYEFALYDLRTLTIVDTWRFDDLHPITARVEGDRILVLTADDTPGDLRAEIHEFVVGDGPNFDGAETIASLPWPRDGFAPLGDVKDFARVGDEYWIVGGLNSEERDGWPVVVRYTVAGDLIEALDLNFVDERWLNYIGDVIEPVEGGVLIGAIEENSFGSGPCEDSDVRSSGCVRSFLLQLSEEAQAVSMAPIEASTLFSTPFRRYEDHVVVETRDGFARVDLF